MAEETRPNGGADNKEKEIKIEVVSKYALLGAMMGRLGKRNPAEVEDKVRFTVKTFAEDCDVYEECGKLREFFPKASVSIFRSGEREVWK